MDFAVVSVAALVAMNGGVCTEARITLGAVAPRPVRATGAEEALKGTRPEATMLEQAAGLAMKGAKPLSMNGYKVEITKALVARTLAACL